MGSGNAAQTAKEAELNRSTAYLLLEELVRRGFVVHVPNAKVKRYMPVDPVKLVQIARDRADKMKGVEKWDIRFLPKDFSIEMDLAIVDDIVCITHFDPLYSVVIRSKPLADSLLNLFELIWVNAK